MGFGDDMEFTLTPDQRDHLVGMRSVYQPIMYFIIFMPMLGFVTFVTGREFGFKKHAGVASKLQLVLQGASAAIAVFATFFVFSIVWTQAWLLAGLAVVSVVVSMVGKQTGLFYISIAHFVSVLAQTGNMLLFGWTAPLFESAADVMQCATYFVDGEGKGIETLCGPSKYLWWLRFCAMFLLAFSMVASVSSMSLYTLLTSEVQRKTVTPSEPKATAPVTTK